MKHILLTCGLAITGQAILGQGCNELFVSEYVEGWSNNKAIELYNPTANAIDLVGYRLERFSNGSQSAAANQKTDLSGIIQPYSTYVFVLDKQDPDGIEQEAPIWEELAAMADAFINPIYDENNTMYFNGNDAMVLRKIAGNVVIDVFGKIGEDPGEPNDGGGWNNVAPDFAWHLNQATPWSANHTLVRIPEITVGDTNPTNNFNVGAEWDSLLANTFTSLGTHLCLCNPDNVIENSAISVSVFPNPLKGSLQLVAATPILSIVLSDLSGKTVAVIAPGRSHYSFIPHVRAGLYTYRVETAHGIATGRLVVE